jgi:hypothetical protein
MSSPEPSTWLSIIDEDAVESAAAELQARAQQQTLEANKDQAPVAVEPDVQSRWTSTSFIEANLLGIHDPTRRIVCCVVCVNEWDYTEQPSPDLSEHLERHGLSPDELLERYPLIWPHYEAFLRHLRGGEEQLLLEAHDGILEVGPCHVSDEHVLIQPGR